MNLLMIGLICYIAYTIYCIMQYYRTCDSSDIDYPIGMCSVVGLGIVDIIVYHVSKPKKEKLIPITKDEQDIVNYILTYMIYDSGKFKIGDRFLQVLEKGIELRVNVNDKSYGHITYPLNKSAINSIKKHCIFLISAT